MVDVPTVGVDPKVGAGVVGTSPNVGFRLGAYVFAETKGGGLGGRVLLEPSGSMLASTVGAGVS